MNTSRVTVEYSEGARLLAEALFAPQVSDHDLAAAVGALAGASVLFTLDAFQRLKAYVRHRWIEEQERVLFRNHVGDLVIRNQFLMKSFTAPTGVGIRVFLTQVRAAKKLGVKKMLTTGAGSPAPEDYVGYYIFARFGFDAPLDDHELVALRARFPTVKTLNQLMKAGGQAWWRENGFEKEMVFDLADDSSMMEILNAYVVELKAQGRL